VNTETVAIRAKEEGWITDKTLASFKATKPVVVPRKDKVDPDLPPNLSPAQVARFELAFQHGVTRYFLELVRRGVTEDRITFGRCAEMLDMTVEEAQDFILAVGMAL
jgi:hypothetical protein